MRRTRTVAPAGASLRTRLVAAVPRATSTAPSGGIGVPPPLRTSVTGPETSVFGSAAGNGRTTTSKDPGATGVLGPHAGV